MNDRPNVPESARRRIDFDVEPEDIGPGRTLYNQHYVDRLTARITTLTEALLVEYADRIANENTHCRARLTRPGEPLTLDCFGPNTIAMARERLAALTDTPDPPR